MLAMGIEYLTGYAVATDTANRDRPEWPPHPARIFMAMAAAYFETGEDPAERESLLWLEKNLTPPVVVASECDERQVVTHFVPVNDELNPASSSLPMLRRRQARGFPRVRPHDPVVYCAWEDIPANPLHWAALDRLCRKVTRIGHSSSLVRMWVTDSLPKQGDMVSRWLVDEYQPELHLRVITPGSLDELTRRFRANDLVEFDRLTIEAKTGTAKAKTAAKAELTARFSDLRPQPIRPKFRITAGYRREEPLVPRVAQSLWDPQLFIFGIEPDETCHRALDIRASLNICRMMRDAAMSVNGSAGRSIPEALSGHQSDGAPSQSTHCLFFALPFVGRPHADGHLMGIAVACPRSLPQEERRHIARALGLVPKLTLGSLGTWELTSGRKMSESHNLRARTWCATPQGATHWASVTPIVFDEHPKSKDREGYLGEVAEMICRACERAGLPKPVTILPSHVSVHEGVPTSLEFPRMNRKDGSQRRHLHARIVFDRPVVGPILIGAGRYRGYGLLRPLSGDCS